MKANLVSSFLSPSIHESAEPRAFGRVVGFIRNFAPYRGLFLVLVELLASTIFIYCFCRAFRLSQFLILIHLPLVTGVLAAALFVPGLLLYCRWIREWEATKYWLATILGAAFSVVAILYAADFASYSWTGANLNYKLVYLYFWDLRQGGDIISLSPSIYISVVAFVLAVLAIHVACAGAIFRGLQTLLLPELPNSLSKKRRHAARASMLVVILLFAYCVGFYVLLQRAPYSELLSADPLLSLVRSSTELRDPEYPAIAERVRREDEQCRNSYPRNLKFEKKNVIIIMADALRADHTQLYGYDRATTPFLKKLFDSGHLRRVKFATSTCSGTFCGVMSTLASRHARRLISGNYKIYDLLHDEGYETYLILSGGHDYQGLREAYGPEMTMYFDGLSSSKYTSTDDRLIFEGLERVPQYSGTPAFFYFHLMATHLTGIKQESFRVYQPAAERNYFRLKFRADNKEWPKVINAYDNGVVQVDATIEQIFDTLKAKGYLQNSLVVIMADHGEGLGERNGHSWGHSLALYQEHIRIPLLIYDVSSVKYENLEFATQVDIAPTIVDRLGLPIPGCWQGKSLLGADVERVTSYRSDSPKPCYAIIHRTNESLFKYIYCVAGKTEELYDLVKDPGEEMNLIGTADGGLVQRMREELQRSRSD